MSGAFATTQGDCSQFKSQTPHSCKRSPVIADLMPDAPPESRTDGCCHGGLIASWAVNPSKSFSSFEMKVGNLSDSNLKGPVNLTLLAPGPGYTCGLVEETDPSVSYDIGGRRQVQAYKTWKSTCTYSSFIANRAPTCCVSLSTFYNPKVTPCPDCSCGCREETDQNTLSCIREDSFSPQSDPLASHDIVRCTDHMCPVRVHWHVMKNYLTHWRVKLTISNYNYNRKYFNWNVLVQHPGFSQTSTAYSFNSTMLPSYDFSDGVALFWGIEYYNDELLNSDEYQIGSVSTEILLKKDLHSFTLASGWALPRRIYFNGENCQMPLPDTFPRLPNHSTNQKPAHPLFLLLIYLIFKTQSPNVWFWQPLEVSFQAETGPNSL
ncbi:Glycosyl-phosphatidyl inositol-anchored, plant [Corchorus capsularis]|uniref:Glycosyl-phosphatidyl inositol-anchored, plant n=1 Tax=Corchorus capsularis TaxID=210143 RepID=A0A1R3HVS2_COCAP|nr:Glycosyl-phosphatidyl inositol-anchored, plant [Corchorus capsularis]